MSVNKDNNEDSIINAYKLYESLCGKDDLIPSNELTNVFLAKNKQGLVFIQKGSLKGRFKSTFSKNSLNYQENIKKASILLSNIQNSNEESLKKAIEELNRSKPNVKLTPEKVLQNIALLRDFLVQQKKDIEMSKSKKGIDVQNLKAITLVDSISLKVDENEVQKVIEKTQNFFKESVGYRKSQIETKLKAFSKLFNKPFSSEELQEIASFLSTYSDTPEILEQLKKGNSEPFHLAMMKALSFASEGRVEIFIKILDNIPMRAIEGQNPLKLQNFGMVFGDSFIKDSGLEGEVIGSAYVNLAENYFKHKKVNKTLSQKENAILNTLSNHINLDSKDTPAEVRKKIKDQLAKSLQNPKKCILLGGWMTHCLVYEVEQQKDGKLTFRIYNEGEGIQYHDRIHDKYKTKYAGCIGVKDIPEKLFFRRSFIASLQGVAKLSGPAQSGTSPIQFLVGHLLPMLGGVKETSNDRTQQFLSPQKSGTCTYRSTLAFLAHSMSREEYKLFKLDFKLYMLDLYYPQLHTAGTSPVDATNYDVRQLELSTIRQSIEKFSEGLKKLKDSLPPEKIKLARNKIMVYQSQLIKLEQGILKYEKELYAQALTQNLSKTEQHSFQNPRSDTHINKGQNDVLISRFAASQLVWQTCAPTIAAINSIGRDSPQLSTQIENCLAEFSKLVVDKKVPDSEKILIASQFFQKIGSISAWDTIIFTKPLIVQKQLKSLTDQFGAMVNNSLLDHKVERVCIYFSLCYALEKVTRQLPKELIIIDLPEKSAINTPENQSLLKSLRTSDPFWVEYIQGMTQLQEAGSSLKFFSKEDVATSELRKTSEKMFLSKDIAKQIWKWAKESDSCAPIREVMQISIALDRKEQTKKCVEIEEFYNKRKLTLEAQKVALEATIKEEKDALVKIIKTLGSNQKIIIPEDASNGQNTNYVKSPRARSYYFDICQNVLNESSLKGMYPQFIPRGSDVYMNYQIPGGENIIFHIDNSGNLKPNREYYIAYINSIVIQTKINENEKRFKETITELDNLGRLEENAKKAVRDDLQYWPMGFDLTSESGKTDSFKGSFLFLDQPNFIRSKFNQDNINEAMKALPPSAKKSLEEIAERGDLLSKEFRAYTNCSLMCQNLPHKSALNPLEIILNNKLAERNSLDEIELFHSTLTIDSSGGINPLTANEVKDAFTSFHSVETLNEDVYHKDITNSQIRELYIRIFKSRGFSETNEPTMSQSFLNSFGNLRTNGTSGLNRDEIPEIFSLCVAKNIQIDAVLNYFQENMLNLEDPDWSKLFHSFLFESNLLLKELENSNTCEILLPKLEFFFQQAIQNAMELEEFEMAANLFWIATNVQKYVDVVSEKRAENLGRLKPIINKELIFEIVNKVSNHKFKNQWAGVFEAVLASCTHLLKSPILLNDPDEVFFKKIIGQAWTAHIMGQRLQIAGKNQPKKEDADRFILSLNRFLADAAPVVLQQDVLDIVNTQIAPTLARFYPSLSHLQFNVKKDNGTHQQDIFESADGTTISLIEGGLTSTNRDLLKVYDQPLPTWSIEYLKNKNIYPNIGDIDQLRCYFSGNNIYIQDKKNGLELYLSKFSHQNNYLFIKFPWSNNEFVPKIDNNQDNIDNNQANYELGRLHHFVSGNRTYMCDKNFKLLYQGIDDKVFKSNEGGALDLGSKLVKLPRAESLFSSFESPECTLCWANEQNQLKEIEFPRLNLDFKRTEEGKWELSQQKGWYLAQDQFAPHFGQKTGFLVLENKEGHKKVLLPVWPSKEVTDKRSLNFPVEYKFNENLSKGHYVECKVEDSQLIPSSLEARFHLAHIFLQKGKLDEAEKLLFAIEADPSHKAFSNEEKKILENIIQWKNIGSRTLRMQAKVIYLLTRNEAQFPNKTEKTTLNQEQIELIKELEKRTIKLMEAYLERLAHVKALDRREELLILQKMPNIGASWSLKARLNELTDGSTVDTPLTNVNEGDNWPTYNLGYVDPHAVSFFDPPTLKEKFTYQRCRRSNTFPFDPKEPNLETLSRYMPLILKECRKGLTWETACQNGMAPTLYALLLFTQGNSNKFYSPIRECLSFIKKPIASSQPPLTASPANRIANSVKANEPKKSTGLATPIRGIPNLVVLNEIKAAENENTFLPSLAKQYLQDTRAQPLSVSENVFAGNSLELVDATTIKQFEYCRQEIEVAQRREDFNYRIKDNIDNNDNAAYKELRFEIEQSIAEQASTLAIQERVIIDALSSALSSNPLSNLSFISKNRKLPSIDEICIYCARKNRDTYLKELFPELSPEDLKALKEAAKNYLVEKQFLQHLKQALCQVDDVLNAPCITQQDFEDKGMLEDALGRNLVSKRAYDLETDPNAMVFLQLETMLGIQFRDDQIKNIQEFIDAIEHDKEVVLQMIMGAGKTSVLQPLLGFLLAKPDALSTVIVPGSLLKTVKGGLAKVLGQSFHLFVTSMDYNRDLSKDENYLKNFLTTIKDAKARGSVFLLDPNQKQSIITSLYEVYEEVRNNPRDNLAIARKTTIMEICNFLQLNEADQVDEIDTVYNPQVTFKYPIGAKSVVNTESASLLSEIVLALANDNDISDKVSLDFVKAFKIRRGDKISEKAVALNKDLFKDIVQPKLSSTAIEHLRQKSFVIDGLFTDPLKKKKAELYFPHFLMNSTPFDEEIQAQCLPAKETKIYEELKKESPEVLDRLAKSTPKTTETLIAQKIRFQKKMKTWIKDNVPLQRDRDLIGTCGIAISQVLPNALNKVCGSEYGEDPKEGAFVARPYDAPESPKTTMFATTEEQVIYSTQQILYYGIPENEARQILERYQEDAKQEMQSNNVLLIDTTAYKTILKSFKGNLSGFIFLESPLSEKFIKAFQQNASQDNELINLYLRTSVYPQISEYHESLTCTPQALGGSSKLQCGYTGTLHEGVLTRTQTAKPEKGTNGRTISAVQSKMEAGRGVTEVLNPVGGKSLSTAMVEKFKNDPDLFVFIDSGGWLKEEKINDYAAKLLMECRESRKDIEGIVYHDKDGTIVCLELDESDPSKNQFIKVPIALSRLKTTSGKTLTIIGQKYETGTNIPQKANAKAYISIRKDMLLRDVLQSIFRMRQILLNQSVSFGLTTEVSDSIASGILDGLFLDKNFKTLFTTKGVISEQDINTALGPLKLLGLDIDLETNIRKSLRDLNTDTLKKPITPRTLALEFSNLFKKNFNIDSATVWRYFAINQAHVEQEKNWLAGKHKMKEVVEKPIRMALSDPSLEEVDRDFIFEKFKGFLIETTQKSPFERFSSEGSYVDSQQAINQEINRNLDILKILNSFPSNPGFLKIRENLNTLYNKGGDISALDQRITRTLEECVKIEDIPPLIFVGNSDLGQELEQEEEQQEQVKLLQENTIQSQIKLADGNYNLREKDYTPLVPSMDISKFFELDNLGPIKDLDIISPDLCKIGKDLNLKFSTNLFIDGAHFGSEHRGHYHLPGRYLLVISDPTNPKAPTYMLVSHQDAGHIKNAILTQSLIKPPRALSLITFDGSPSACTDLNIAHQLITQPQFKKIAVLSKILTGKISYNKNEIKILEEMLDATDNPHSNAEILNGLLYNTFSYLPSGAKKFSNSSLQKSLLKKMKPGAIVAR